MTLALPNYISAQGIDLESEHPEAPAVEGQTATSAGLGFGIVPDYEGSSDYTVVPLPYLSIRFANNMSVLWVANKASANLVPDRNWMAGPIVEYIRSRADVDNNRVDRMKNVDAALMMGGFVGYRIDRFTFSLEAMQDVANANDGAIVRLKGLYHMPINEEWSALFIAYTTWASDDYMDAYFGVDGADSRRSGLNTYDADAGFKDVGFVVPVTYTPYEHWSFMGAVGYKRLVGDAEDSPVVDDAGEPNQFIAGAFVIYKF
jgi:outer membrane scaffolding protein for murein synthesis (MipA/OmpV family)